MPVLSSHKHKLDFERKQSCVATTVILFADPRMFRPILVIDSFDQQIGLSSDLWTKVLQPVDYILLLKKADVCACLGLSSWDMNEDPWLIGAKDEHEPA